MSGEGEVETREMVGREKTRPDKDTSDGIKNIKKTERGEENFCRKTLPSTSQKSVSLGQPTKRATVSMSEVPI